MAAAAADAAGGGGFYLGRLRLVGWARERDATAELPVCRWSLVPALSQLANRRNVGGRVLTCRRVGVFDAKAVSSTRGVRVIRGAGATGGGQIVRGQARQRGLTPRHVIVRGVRGPMRGRWGVGRGGRVLVTPRQSWGDSGTTAYGGQQQAATAARVVPPPPLPRARAERRTTA